MQKSKLGFLFLWISFLLCGCSAGKATSIWGIYAATAVLALLLLIGYCCIHARKSPWFLLLFVSVFVVNSGYFVLSTAPNLAVALNANRLSYLGSVFLPLSMWMIIANISGIPYRKWLPRLLIGIAVVVFLIAASPGYLDIYYKEVTFQKINGIVMLKKVYGPLHSLYLVYLLGYFAAMITVIIHAVLQDKLESTSYAVILAIAVFVNIGVWMIEQLVQIDFEILSVSYIITELFLLGLHLFMAEVEKQKAQLLANVQERYPPDTEGHKETDASQDGIDREQLELFVAGLCHLTPKEREIYEYYVAGMRSAEIMAQLNIKENTLKFHNKNLYGKLGVNSRKQLVRIHNILAEETTS